MPKSALESFLPADLREVSDMIRAIDNDYPPTISEINLMDGDGNPLRFALVRNTLTDGSETYDVVVTSVRSA